MALWPSCTTTPISGHCATQLRPRHASGMPLPRPNTNCALWTLNQHKAGATGGYSGAHVLVLLLIPVQPSISDTDALECMFATALGQRKSIVLAQQGIGLYSSISYPFSFPAPSIPFASFITCDSCLCQQSKTRESTKTTQRNWLSRNNYFEYRWIQIQYLAT